VAQVFDREVISGVADWEYTWQSFDADLPAGDVTLSLTKHEQNNCVGYVRHVDYLLLTTDQQMVPDHLAYGPQTLLRVTLGEEVDRPVYLHLFVDHYRDPWYAHFTIGQDGLHAALAPPAGQMLKPGEATPWCNLTPTVYQDSGAALNLSLRHSYYEKAKRFPAKLEFGRDRSRSLESSDRSLTTSATGVERGELASLEPYQNSGKFLSYLNPQDTVTWGDQQLEVLSVKQPLKLRGNADLEILATFKDGQPAAVTQSSGQGDRVHTWVLANAVVRQARADCSTSARTESRC